MRIENEFKMRVERDQDFNFIFFFSFNCLNLFLVSIFFRWHKINLLESEPFFPTWFLCYCQEDNLL